MAKGRGIDRWLRFTRRVGDGFRGKLAADDDLAQARGDRPEVEPGRSVYERTPAPRGNDALHEKAQHSHMFHWFGEEHAARQNLAQRAAEVLAGLGPVSYTHLTLPTKRIV